MTPREAEQACPLCGEIPKPRYYEKSDLLLQTPQSVWKMYKENGYTLAQAMREESSYR